MSRAAPSALEQAAGWSASAVAAAAMLAGVAAALTMLPAPGDSQGEIQAPVILTLVGPKAVAALPTPPPHVSADEPTSPVQPADSAPPPSPAAETPPQPDAAPRPPVPGAPDTPAIADATALPPAPVPEPAVQSEPARKPKKRPAEKPAEKPAPKPAKPATDPAPTASVTGDGGKTAKASGSDGVKAATGASAAAMQRWGAAIRKRIEARKAYPAAANGAQGTVTLRLTVRRDGTLTGVGIVSSSGVAALDKAAVRAVQSARLPAAPDGAAETTRFTVPMTFTQ